MSDSNDDMPTFFLLMDYFVRKMHSASRIPNKVSTFSGRDQMLELLSGHGGQFFEVLRMKKECFLRLCGLLAKKWPSRNKVNNYTGAGNEFFFFFMVVRHCDSNRQSGYEWHHLGETISRHFNNVCSHLVRLAHRLIGPPDFETLSPIIADNRNLFPYF